MRQLRYLQRRVLLLLVVVVICCSSNSGSSTASPASGGAVTASLLLPQPAAQQQRQWQRRRRRGGGVVSLLSGEVRGDGAKVGVTATSSSTTSITPTDITADSIDPIFRDTKIGWAIDMDGTLIREDVTEMAIMKSLRRPWRWPIFLYGMVYLSLIRHPRSGAAHGQRFFETKYVTDPTGRDTVTYNEQLIALIRSFQQQGSGGAGDDASGDPPPPPPVVILATASHYKAAEPIVTAVCADRELVFDDVIGSCDVRGQYYSFNAAGAEKARVLDRRFPSAGGFIYAGNSKDDLNVWNHPQCRAMILVNCSPTVLRKAQEENEGKPFIVIP